MEPDEDDGNENDEDDDDAVRSGGVAAIMEQRMNGEEQRISGKIKEERCKAIAERSTVRRNECSFREVAKL